MVGSPYWMGAIILVLAGLMLLRRLPVTSGGLKSVFLGSARPVCRNKEEQNLVEGGRAGLITDLRLFFGVATLP